MEVKCRGNVVVRDLENYENKEWRTYKTHKDSSAAQKLKREYKAHLSQWLYRVHLFWYQGKRNRNIEKFVW